eukprot:gene23256-31582_t
MGNLFAPEKPLKEVIRENQRMLKKSIRELEKEIRTLESNEKKLIADIKKSAKANQMSSVKIMAKDLVRTRNYITRFIEMKTHLNAVSLKMQTIKSHDAMAQAMKGIMADFMKENERAEITEEVIGDTIDDAMADENSEAQEDAIVNQVLDELGISVSESVPVAPMGPTSTPAEPEAEVKRDPALADLQARLNSLNQG